MDDRTMLELAAKAAGIDGRWTGDYCEYDYQYDAALEPQSGMMIGGPRGEFWNPLTSDGDALRLAVKLGMTVGQYNGSVFVGYGDDACEEVEPIGADACAATRRAIVRAAAEIGKGMETADAPAQ